MHNKAPDILKLHDGGTVRIYSFPGQPFDVALTTESGVPYGIIVSIDAHSRNLLLGYVQEKRPTIQEVAKLIGA